MFLLQTLVTSNNEGGWRLCFHPFVRLFVCLFVCEQDISKHCGRNHTEFGGQVGCVRRMNRFDFGEDPNPNPDPDTRNFF